MPSGRLGHGAERRSASGWGWMAVAIGLFRAGSGASHVAALDPECASCRCLVLPLPGKRKPGSVSVVAVVPARVSDA